MLTTDVENYPGFADGHPRPRADGADGEAGGAVRRRDPAGARDRGRPVEPPVRGQGRRPGHGARGRVIVATGASARWLGVPGEETAPRARRERVRHVRRLLLPRPRAPRRRRRRHGDGGGHLPHEVRDEGDDRAPARRVPRIEDHAGPRAREPEDRGDLEHRRRARSSASDAVTGVTLRDIATGEATRVAAPTASSWRSATIPNTSLFAGQLELDDDGYLHRATSRARATNVPGVFAAGDVTDTDLPAGRHGRRPGLQGRDRRRAVPGGTGAHGTETGNHHGRPSVGRLRRTEPSRPETGAHDDGEHR